MDTPQSFKFNGHQVFELGDLIRYDQAYFYGCLKRPRDILTKKKVTIDDYFYAKITKKGWEESNPSYSRAKILLKSEWVKSNVTKFLDNSSQTSSNISVLREAPILQLEEHEKFRGTENNTYEVEVRGVREEDKIYFRGKDLERVFQMENLVRDLTHDENAFEKVIDYEVFLLTYNSQNGGERTVTRKRTYFTYNGLLKVIFRSNSGVGYRFRKWATTIIYTAHLGTQDQRFVQALDMVGVNSSLVKKVFDTCVTQVPCVYLFYIGKVSRMLKHYPELKPFRSGMVFKYGKTISLYRRLIEHIKDYEAFKKAN